MPVQSFQCALCRWLVSRDGTTVRKAFEDALSAIETEGWRHVTVRNGGAAWLCPPCIDAVAVAAREGT